MLFAPPNVKPNFTADSIPHRDRLLVGPQQSFCL
jgi:hypothetical protein